jgi:flagellar basal-body rod modification protein FlgD
MTTSAVTSSTSAGGLLDAQAQAFRNADFLKIMLSELSQQDPMKPQETSKIVENMQKLQELANTQYTKFRADLQWGQQLMGKNVNVQQQILTESQKQNLINAGLNPDVGYGNKDGVVNSFRQVGETVYVSIGDYDYPIDNVKQVRPDVQETGNDPDYLSNIAGNLLGRTVGYKLDNGTMAQGKVTDVGYDSTGEVMLNINGLAVPYRNLVKISS